MIGYQQVKRGTEVGFGRELALEANSVFAAAAPLK